MLGTIADDLLERLPHNVELRCKALQPSYSVNVLNQDTTIRWGPNPNDCERLLYGGRVLARKTCTNIFGGLEATSPELGCHALKRLSERIRHLFLFFYPDGVAGNQLLIDTIDFAVPKALIFAQPCTVHGWSLSTNHSTEAFALIDFQYSLASTLSDASAVVKVGEEIMGMAPEIQIFAGIPPAKEYEELQDFVLHYTVKRSLITGTLLPTCAEDAGNGIHNENMTTQALDGTCNYIKEFFNGDWRCRKLQHYCYDRRTGHRCHPTDAAVRKDCKKRLEVVRQETVQGLKRPSKNDWGTLTKSNKKICFGLNCHNVVCTGVERFSYGRF